jgi:hypothetical protein
VFAWLLIASASPQLASPPTTPREREGAIAQLREQGREDLVGRLSPFPETPC